MCVCEQNVKLKEKCPVNFGSHVPPLVHYLIRIWIGTLIVNELMYSIAAAGSLRNSYLDACRESKRTNAETFKINREIPNLKLIFSQIIKFISKRNNSIQLFQVTSRTKTNLGYWNYHNNY